MNRTGRPRTWTRDVILRRLRELHSQGIDIRPTSLRKTYLYLYRALRKEFGSTWSALKAAGIEPSLVGARDSRSWRRKKSTMNQNDVICELRKRKTEGRSILPARIQADDVRLYRWMLSCFGDSTKAIEAAGFSPAEEGVIRRWSRTSICSKLNEMKRAGLDIRPRSLCVTIPGLYAAGIRLFGDSASMYSAAGYDIKALVTSELPGSWTPDRIINEIRRISESESVLNRNLIARKYPKLLSASERRYRSWYRALEAAGIASEKHRPERPKRWTSERIANQIRQISRSESDLNRSLMLRKYPKLLSACERLYRSWYDALEAAGVGSGEHRREKPKRYWTKQQIVRQIQRISASGERMAWKEVSKNHSDLVAAARNAFGTWSDALQAAGYNPSDVRLRHPEGYWSFSRVISEIQRLKACGEDISSHFCLMNRGKLYTAAIRFYGSWEAAVSAAGIAYGGVRKQREPFTKATLLLALRNLNEEGLPLAASSVRTYDGSIFHASRRLFGSYRRAIEALGLNYDQIRRDWFVDTVKGRLFEEYVRSAFETLGWQFQYHRRFRFSHEICIPDFCDPLTGTWIDAKVSSWTPEVRKTVEKYLRYAPSVVVIYLHKSMTRRPVGTSGVEFIEVKSLYKDLEGLDGHSLVEKLEMLKKGITRPEFQTHLRDFVYRTNPKRAARILATISAYAQRAESSG